MSAANGSKRSAGFAVDTHYRLLLMLIFVRIANLVDVLIASTVRRRIKYNEHASAFPNDESPGVLELAAARYDGEPIREARRDLRIDEVLEFRVGDGGPVTFR